MCARFSSKTRNPRSDLWLTAVSGQPSISGWPTMPDSVVQLHLREGVQDLPNRPGEVHALLGENGAGKSTLMRPMPGVLRPDSGTIAVDGGVVSLRTPLDARLAGIAMIYQELQQVPELTVAQNMFLGRSLTKG